jgi:lysozyme
MIHPGRLASLLATLSLLAACQPGELGDEEEEAIDAELRQCAPGPTVAGLDVSYYQGTVDWPAVARSGRSFSFVRVSDGARRFDPKFAQNYAAVAQAGLYRGVYQYFRASQDPIAQAQLMLDQIGALGERDLPPALDLEELDGQRASIVVARALRWLEHVTAALGRKPLIYIGAGFAQQIADPASLAEYPLWVANWQARCPRMPAAWSSQSWVFWQTRVAPRATGVRTAVDLDVFNGTEAELAALAGPAR